MTQEQIEYGEQFAYKDLAEYEHYLGANVGEAFKIGWSMARLKKKHLGIFEPDKEELTSKSE